MKEHFIMNFSSLRSKPSQPRSLSKANPNYPSKTGNPSGKGRGNTPKSGGNKGGGSKSSK